MGGRSSVVSTVDDRGAGGAPPRVTNALVALAVALALVLIIATAQGASRPPDAIAFLFAAGLGALMLLRRRMPRTVLVLSVLGVFAYNTMEYPPIGVAVPVFGALFAAADAGLTAWAVSAGGIVFFTSLYFRLRDGDEELGFVLGYETVSNTALFAAAIALGHGLRARRVQRAQQTEIGRLTEAQIAREAEMRMQSERESVSRELHDTVGHTLSVVALHAGVGAEAVGRDDRAVADAFEQIRSTSTHSLRELRSMVRILRSAADHDEGRNIRSLSAVQELVDTAGSAGLEVRADITATPAELSAPVDTAAYRVIQESITNVIRHADAGCAQVRAHVQDDRLHISITDDGRGAPAADALSGYGLAGMSERIRLLGGELSTRSRPGGGFIVEATLPARLES